MKNFKIAMILVAAVAFFCSCGGNSEAPTVSLLDAEGTSIATYETSADSYAVKLNGKVTDAKGITKLDVTRTFFNANDEVVGDVVTYTFSESYDGLTEYAFVIDEAIAKADVNGVAKVVYKAVAENKNAQADAEYTINITAPSFTEGTFEWVREGSNRTGLDTYGLQWTSNAKVIQAVIKPLEGAKLYILEAADYAATSLSAITFPAEATQYKSVSCEANGDYNDVIATVYNGKTYVMNVTKGTVTTSAAGTKVTITGNVKTFEATPTVAAK